MLILVFVSALGSASMYNWTSDGRFCAAERRLDPAYVAAKLMNDAGWPKIRCSINPHQHRRHPDEHNGFENVSTEHIPVTQAG